MTTRLRLIGLLCLLLVTIAPRAKAADIPTTNRFEKEILAYEAQDKTNPPPQGVIVFTGASGIRMWKSLTQNFPNHKVVNRGFGGCHMSDVLFYADRIILPYKPRMVVVQAGGNDLNGNKTPAQVLRDFQALVEKVRVTLPETRIAYLSISPSPARWSQIEKQKETNRLVREYVSQGSNLDYIELYDAFLNAQGEPRAELFVADKLHHNAEGYKVRTAVVLPHMPK